MAPALLSPVAWLGSLLLWTGSLLLEPVRPEPVSSSQDSTELRAAWGALTDKQKLQVVSRLESECRKLPTSQAKTIYWVIDNEEVDAGFLKPAVAAPIYLAEDHAPAYVIQRLPLAPDDPALLAMHERILPKPSPRGLRKAYDYDWTSGSVVVVGDPKEPERIFENALHGFYPGQDLALAIALKDLDDGRERAGLVAFGHAYANNEGDLFPGITLYDVFWAGRDVDLPDLDALGLVHDTLEDWDTWLTPIQDQEGIYGVLTGEFGHLKRYRELREALADALFLAQPVSLTGYDVRRTQLHAQWIQAGFEPRRLRERLPSREQHALFLEEMGSLARKQPGLFSQAQQRETQLKRDRSYVLRVLKRSISRIAAAGE